MAAILIVDDEQDTRELIQGILEDAGYQTLTASNRNKALKVCAKKQPDLLIVNIFMPEKDGIETIIGLIRIGPCAKIIAISGGGKVDPYSYLPIAKRLGATATIFKPIDRNELLSTVRNLLLDSV